MHDALVSVNWRDGMLGAAWLNNEEGILEVWDEDRPDVDPFPEASMIAQSTQSVLLAARCPPALRSLFPSALVKPSLDYAASSDAPNRASLGALAALQRHAASMSIPISGISETRTGNMHLPKDSIASLDILSIQDHPNLHWDKNVRGACVLAILDKCKTMMGKGELREWLLKPEYSEAMIDDKRAAVKLLVSNINLLGRLQEALRPMRNVRHMLIRLRSGEDEFLAVGRFLRACLKLIESIRDELGNFKVINTVNQYRWWEKWMNGG
jgi:DNA mismatch repair ATPase MutS